MLGLDWLWPWSITVPVTVHLCFGSIADVHVAIEMHVPEDLLRFLPPRRHPKQRAEDCLYLPCSDVVAVVVPGVLDNIVNDWNTPISKQTAKSRSKRRVDHVVKPLES